jgi:sugar O-acyltransferase (sialic acid O-acetyltransferase NeuD family)
MQIGIIGYGALGKQIRSLICENHQDFEFVYFDDNHPKSVNCFAFDEYRNTQTVDRFIVGLGYKHPVLKKNIITGLQNSSKLLYSFVHPTTYMHASAEIGEGSVIYPMCTIDMGISIGPGTILNNQVTVCHDSTIGACVYIAPGVVVSGNVTIGDCSFIGSGSLISNHITIGNHVTIGIGSVITKNIPDNSFVIGNPMRFVQRIHLD